MDSVAVYCGSAAGNSPAYAEAARQLGEELARRGLTLVYGGGNVGLMGIVADACLDAGEPSSASSRSSWWTWSSPTRA